MFRRLFALGDPRWGRGSDSTDAQEPTQPAATDRPSEPPPKADSDDARSHRPTEQNQQPPDLDEVWRNFNRKLNGLFGGKGGGRPNKNPFGNGPDGPNGSGGSGGGGSNGSGLPFPAKVLWLVPGVLIALWLASGFHTVQEGQTSVVLRFGEYKYSTQPGINWRFPSPIEQHEIVDLSQLRQATVGFQGSRNGQSRDSLMLTRDENMIDIQFAIQYRVANPEMYLFENVRPDDIVQQAAETAMREVVGRSLSDSVLYENKEAIGREAAEITQRIADRYKSGLTIVNVTIQNVQPPEEVQAAFNDAIRAAQDAERLKNEGQAYANDVIPRARGSAARLLEEAQGYRERVIATAEGDASRFNQVVNEYRQAPAVTRERLYLETMQQVFSSVSKVMIDSQSNSNLMYLPLDKIIEQTSRESEEAARRATTARDGVQPTSPAPSPSSSTNTTDNSLRDRFRAAR